MISVKVPTRWHDSRTKVNNLDVVNKIPEISSLVTTNVLNTKIGKVEN